MLTEEKTESPDLPPELFAAAGRYYIMDRRPKPPEEPPEAAPPPEEQAEPPALAARRSHLRRSEDSAAGYMLLGLLGAAAGAAIVLLYPLEGAVLPSSTEFLPLLTDRLLRCGAFLTAAYLLGYFAAGAVLVWILPLLCGLGAGVSAAQAVISGEPLSAVLQLISTAAVSFAAARSAGFSRLLLSIATGRGGSVITDGSTGSSYTMKFALYLMISAAAAIAEAGISAI